nr:MAG TPA: hypothetical protein [Caudoviricetes sp.]
MTFFRRCINLLFIIMTSFPSCSLFTSIIYGIAEIINRIL